MHEENTYLCRSYAKVCKSCTNELAWLNWNIVLYTSPSLPSQKRKYGKTVVLLFTFGLNHNFKIPFFFLKFASLSEKSWMNVTFLLRFFHSAYEFLGVSINSLVTVTSSESPLKLLLKFTFKLFFFNIALYLALSYRKIIR